MKKIDTSNNLEDGSIERNDEILTGSANTNQKTTEFKNNAELWAGMGTNFKKSKILTRSSSKALIEMLPEFSYIKMVYDSSENGRRMKDFLACCNKIKGKLILMKTDKNETVGVYSDNYDFNRSNFTTKWFMFSVDRKSVFVSKKGLILKNNKSKRFETGGLVTRMLT